MNKTFILFSGYNQRAVISFCRELKALQTGFYIIAKSPDDPVYQSKYKNDILFARQETDLTLHVFKKYIQQIRKQTGDTLILCPSSEFLNFFLLHHAAELTRLGCEIPLVNPGTYGLISNKYSFSGICKKHHIAVPEEYNDYRNTDYPFVARPYKNISNGQKTLYPYIIFSRNDLAQFLKNENADNFYFQAYIPGQSYYLLYYFSLNDTVIKYSQKNLLQQANGKSIVFAQSSDIHNRSISEKFERLLHSIRFKGLIMIEIMYYNGEYIAIEANPRFWGPAQLFVDARVPIFKNFIYDYLGKRTNPFKQGSVKGKSVYLWFNGIMENLLSHKKLKRYGKMSSMYLFLLIIRHLKDDIYLRKDTFKIFISELVTICKNHFNK
jgi:predicted ATP-grasp superfamily ATP-dependent carboligase